MLVAGVYGKNPLLLASSMSSQAKNDFGKRACLAASSALGPTALNDMPGGSMKPFCAPPMETSTPHSSCRYSVEASDEMVSTKNSAGCLAASIACRISSIGERQPVEVSLCSTQTALILCPASLRRCASM